MANIRIFGYRGTIQVQQSMVKQYNSDSVFVADEPALWSAVAASNGATPVTMTANLGAVATGGTGGARDIAQLLGIEVPDNFQIRYELQLNGSLASNARPVGNWSRRLANFDFIPWQAGASFQFVDAASFL